MKKLLKAIIYGIAVAVIIVVGGGYLIPENTTVSRSIEIKAPPEKVFAIVGTLKRFNEWSPWADIDPNAKYTFEGPETGVGQKMSWQSDNPEVGKGSQTIVEITDGSRVVSDIDFEGMGDARAWIDVGASEGGSHVKWEFSAKSSGVLERWLSLMYDKWIGADYEKGLGRLKALAEKEAAN